MKIYYLKEDVIQHPLFLFLTVNKYKNTNIFQMEENIINNIPIFVRVNGKFHDRFIEKDRWKLLSEKFPERIYFDEIDEVLI